MKVICHQSDLLFPVDEFSRIIQILTGGCGVRLHKNPLFVDAMQQQILLHNLRFCDVLPGASAAGNHSDRPGIFFQISQRRIQALP